MITDLDLARIQNDTYSPAPAGQVITAGDDLATITRTTDETIISIRGTTTPRQWVSNFKIVGVRPATHPALGVCESGFLEGAMAIYPLLAAQVAGSPVPIIIQGHSRGAGMVPILAGLFLCDVVRIARNVCWEAPWCVGDNAKRMLLGMSIPGVQYWHGDDPVPCGPAVPWLEPNVWGIRHFGMWQLNPFDCHGMDGIIADLAP